MNATCLKRRAHRGTTLIEVVLGLVILSTLLASVVVARGRFVRQWSEADQTLRLVQDADRLIARWLAGPPQDVPINRSGVEGTAAWLTQSVPDREATAVGAVVIRLTMRAARGPNVAVDFLLRDPRLATTQPTEAP